jgi:hypothetical protein
MKDAKHTHGKLDKIGKLNTSIKKKLVEQRKTSSVDSQADKENNTPVEHGKSRRSTKNTIDKSSEKKQISEKIVKTLESGSKSKRKLSKKSPENKIKEEVSEEEKTSKPSVKRVSLKKRVDPVLNESASKASVIESNKENSELIKTPTSSDLPKNTYGLRKRMRGRKPKKSHVYNSAENLIYSHEKEEEMNKLDDSEFKLPNEHKHKAKIIEEDKDEEMKDELSDTEQDRSMSEDITGKFKCHQPCSGHLISLKIHMNCMK